MSGPTNAGGETRTKPNVHGEFATEADGRQVFGSLFGSGKNEFLISFNFKYPRWRAWFAIRMPHVIAFGMFFTGYGFMVYPTYTEHYNALMHYDQPLKDPELHLPNLQPPWWINQWRLNRLPWRNDESVEDFYKPVFEHILGATGRDMLHLPHARNFRKEKEALEKRGVFPVISTSGICLEHELHDQKSVLAPMTTPKPVIPEDMKKEKPRTNSGALFDANKEPKALVPMCGDSPIVAELAIHGYRVDAVDVCDVAVRTAAERLDPLLNHYNCIGNVELLWDDIFSPQLWQRLKTGTYDLIYDRQGMSVLDLETRQDYAFLLKKALKDDGILYTEGTFRTDKRRGNRQQGPPFHFTASDVERHFPLEEGYMVKCNTPDEVRLKDLPSEFRVLGRVPDQLLARGFPCAVWKDQKEAERLLADRRIVS